MLLIQQPRTCHLQRIEQITRLEALHHSNAAWEVHRRLMRARLPLKLSLSSSGLLTKDDKRRATRGQELHGVVSENSASKVIGSSIGKGSTDGQMMPLVVSAGDADHRGITIMILILSQRTNTGTHIQKKHTLHFHFPISCPIIKGIHKCICPTHHQYRQDRNKTSRSLHSKNRM